jgi:hypothetical protein
MFYVTSEPGQQLDLVDFSSGTVTDIYDIGSKPDSVIVNAQGQIFYTVTPLGTLQKFDPNTGQNSVLATFPSGYPRDLVFDPQGNNILVSLYAIGKLGRYNLASGTATIFPSTSIGVTLDGLAYDPAGNLFAVVSRNTVCQLDPATGAILQTVVLEPRFSVNGGDGMVYDPFTKNLWLTHVSTLGNGLIEIPLTESTPPVLGTPIFLQTGSLNTPDGIISDGQGNLFIGEALQHLTQYNIPTNSVVSRVLSPGIDDLAFVPTSAPPGQFSIAITPATITTLDNQTLTYALNITTTNNYAPTFQISCNGLPAPAVCTTAGSSGVGQTQIQVQTQSLAVGTYSFSVSVTDGVTTENASTQIKIGDFIATLSSASVTVGVGKSGTVGVNVSSDNGFSDPVTLSCSSPSGTTCSFSPASVIASSAGTSSSLTIAVASRPTGSAQPGGSVAFIVPWGILTFGMLISDIGHRSRRRLGLGCLVLLCIALTVSCGSGSANSTTAGGGSGGTGASSNPTTFTVAVQATSDNVMQDAGKVTVTVP